MAIVDIGIVLLAGGVITMMISLRIYQVNLEGISELLAVSGILVGIAGLVLEFNLWKAVFLGALVFGFYRQFLRMAKHAKLKSNASGLSPDEARPQLTQYIEWLDEPHLDLRMAGAMGLFKISMEYPKDLNPAISRIVSRLNDPEEQVQRMAMVVLASIVKHYPTETKPTIPKIVELAYDNDDETREVACDSLVLYISPAVNRGWNEELDTIISTLSDSFDSMSDSMYEELFKQLDKLIEKYPMKVVPLEHNMAQLLNHSDPEIRRSACQLLRHIQSVSSLDSFARERVQERTSDPDESVRNIATTMMTESG